MRKLVLLVGPCMLGVLAFGSVAFAQVAPGPGGECPGGHVLYEGPGSASGQCVPTDSVYDPNVGRYIGEGEAEALYGRNADGSIDIPGATATPTATATATPGPVEPLTAAPTATATATATADATGGTAALPETGGLSALSLAALGLLIAGGLLSARLIRR